LITGLQGARQLNNPAGNTDAQGNFTLVGVIAPDSTGPWMQIWSVGGREAGRVSFLVTTATTASAPATPPVAAIPPAANPPVTSRTGFDFTDLFSGTLDVYGFGVPYWALGAGALGLLVVMSNMSSGGRRF
jgi:hypothetical protein